MPDSPLISPAELVAALRSDDPPALVDVRWRLGAPPGLGEYRQGHLPGAVYVDLDAELAGPPGARGRHPMPDPAVVEATMRRAGVSNHRPVVVYDADDSIAASRAWWLLGYLGHGDVHVLDGGFRAWAEARLPVTTDEPSATPGDFVARPGALPVLDAAGAGALAQRGVLLDARTPERFRGEVEPIDKVAGRIPGAHNLNTRENVDPTGRFLPAAELRERFAAAGATPGVEIGAYCGSGVQGAHEVLAARIAGLPAALYVGSWSEWITDPNRPIARGPVDSPT